MNLLSLFEQQQCCSKKKKIQSRAFFLPSRKNRSRRLYKWGRWAEAKAAALAAILMANLLAMLPNSRRENTERHMKVEAALFHRLPLSWVYRDVRSLLCLLESSVSLCVCMCVFTRAGAPIIIVDVRYKTTKTICTTFCCSCFFIFFSCAWRLTDVSVIAVAHKRRRTSKTRVDLFFFFF